MNTNNPYPSPNRAYHRGSSTRVSATANGDPTILLKACPVPPRVECEPAHGLSLVCRVRLAQGVVDSTKLDWSTAFLVVEYGSGDPDVQRAEFDVINGVAVPIVGGGVGTVNVYMAYKAIVLNESLITPDLQVDISLAVSSFGSHGPRAARRTVLVGSLGVATESAVFPIPPYAVGAVLRTNDATAGATIRFTNSPVLLSQSIAVATVQKQEYQSIPVPQAARGFTLETPAETVGAQVMFYLGTG